MSHDQFAVKAYSSDWQDVQLMRDATCGDPHKKRFSGHGKHKGRTAGAFGSKPFPETFKKATKRAQKGAA